MGPFFNRAPFPPPLYPRLISFFLLLTVCVCVAAGSLAVWVNVCVRAGGRVCVCVCVRRDQTNGPCAALALAAARVWNAPQEVITKSKKMLAEEAREIREEKRSAWLENTQRIEEHRQKLLKTLTKVRRRLALRSCPVLGWLHAPCDVFRGW